MSVKSSIKGVGVLGALVLSCSVRVGSPSPSASSTAADSPVAGGAAPDAGTPDAGADAGSLSTVSAPSCTRIDQETRIPAGGGTSDFAWVWDTDHYLVAYSDPSVGGGDIFTLRLGADGSSSSSCSARTARPSGPLSPWPRRMRRRRAPC